MVDAERDAGRQRESRHNTERRADCLPGCELDLPHSACARLIQRPPIEPQAPCGCPPEAFDEDNYTCPHWCIEDVPTNALVGGDIFGIRGDLPLEVTWHVVVGSADPVTGAHYHRPFGGPMTPRGPSTPFKPTQPTLVLRQGMIGRQTLEATDGR